MNIDKNINSILITKFKHIGDVLMLTPMLSVLRERFENASITVVLNKGTEHVLVNNPCVDKIIVFDRDLKKKGFFKNIAGQLSLLKDIRKTNPDMCIELTGGDRGAIIGFFSGAYIRLGYGKGKKGMLGRNLFFTSLFPTDDNTLHAAQRDLKLLELIGISEDVKKYPLKLYVSEEDRKTADDIFRQNDISEDDFVFFVHPVSRWFFKCWEDDKVAAVCDYMKEKYNAVILFSGGSLEQETEKIEGIINLCKNKDRIVDLSGKLSLEVLAAVLEKSSVFFGVDTALMHMASALAKPLVVLFGPTGAHNWKPLNPEAIVVKKDELTCMPCGKAGCNDSKKSRCLEMIEVKDITDSFDKLINTVL